MSLLMAAVHWQAGMAKTVWQHGQDGLQVMQLPQQEMGCPSAAGAAPSVSVAAPSSRDLGHRAGGDQPQQVVGPSQRAGKHSSALCFIQLVRLQAGISEKQMQTSCLNVLIYEFKSTQHTYKRAVSPGLTYKCQTKIHQDWWVGVFYSIQHIWHYTGL